MSVTEYVICCNLIHKEKAKMPEVDYETVEAVVTAGTQVINILRNGPVGYDEAVVLNSIMLPDQCYSRYSMPMEIFMFELNEMIRNADDGDMLRERLKSYLYNSISAYKFEELCDKAKAYVIAKSRTGEADLTEAIGDIENVMAILGMRDFDMLSDYYINIHDLFLEGIYELGNFDDGFETFFGGEYRFNANAISQIAIDFPDDSELHQIAHDLHALQERNAFMICADMCVFEDSDLALQFDMQVFHADGDKISADNVSAVKTAFSALMAWANKKLRAAYLSYVDNDFTLACIEYNNFDYSVTGASL
jgi:hypothetical protein